MSKSPCFIGLKMSKLQQNINKLLKYEKVRVLYSPKNDKNAQKYEKYVKTTMLYRLKNDMNVPKYEKKLKVL